MMGHGSKLQEKAMESDFLLRYQRQMILAEVGMTGQRALRAAKLLVVGAGGLGCPVLQHLAAAGIGCIGICDADLVELSNLHRQGLYNTSDIGNPKVIIAQRRLIEINPHVEIHSFQEMLLAENAHHILSQFDLVLDCTDNFTVRYLISDVCADLKMPWIYGSVSRWEGQVGAMNVALSDFETINSLQGDLVKNGNKFSKNYRDIFPNPPTKGEVLDCQDAGVMGSIAGVVGSLQATEALKFVLGSGKLLLNRILTYRALDATFYTMNLDSNSK